MRLPRGELVRSRVVTDAATALATALDRELTGYAVLEPHESLLLDGDDAGVLTFETGVPVLAYHAGTDRGGPEALADLARPGPYKAELYRLPADALRPAHEVEGLRVPPAMPAEQLGGDSRLADRTRRYAPASRFEEDAAETDPVAAFLDDEEKIAAIREQAREEARLRADEWGLSGALETDEEVRESDRDPGPSPSDEEMPM